MALQEHFTLDIPTEAKHHAKYSHVSIPPTMNVQTIEKDEDGIPI
jgi:hypothetical protein